MERNERVSVISCCVCMRITRLWFVSSTTQIVTQNWILWSGNCMRSLLENQDPTLHLLKDEAWFNLNGYVDSENKGCWPVENPMLFYDVPWHEVKNRVWCPVLSWEHIHTDTLHTSWHHFLSPVRLREKLCLSQQDGAKTHTISNPTRVLTYSLLTAC